MGKKIYILLIIGLTSLGFLLEGSRQAEVSQPSSLPNILFVIADDASYPFMSAYGCEWVKTPNFDWVAENGILFNNAFVPNNKCAPARACILTGRNSWQLEAAADHVPYFPPKYKTFDEALKENGYFTGYTGKGWGPGVEPKVKGKKRYLTGKPYNRIKTAPPTAKMSGIDYAANFKSFLDARPTNKPFCFWLGTHEPHKPYEYGSGIKKGGMETSGVTRVLPFWPDNDSVRTDLLDYAFALEYFDRQLGRAIQFLRESGALNNTLIVVTADNGMPFPRMKGQEYAVGSRVPLAVMWKNGIRRPGRTVDDFVSFIDFAPTFLELAGLNAGSAGMKPVTGKSLTDIFYSPESGMVDPERNYVLLGKERHDVGRPHDRGYPIRSIVTKDYQYIHNFKPDRWPAGNPETGYLNVDGSPTKTACIEAGENWNTVRYWQWSFGKRDSDELYAIHPDPNCLNNLDANPEYRSVLDSLKHLLFTRLKKQGDPRMFGRGYIFDQYPYANPRNRHFYKRYMEGDSTLGWGWVNKTDFGAYHPDPDDPRLNRWK